MPKLLRNLVFCGLILSLILFAAFPLVLNTNLNFKSSQTIQISNEEWQNFTGSYEGDISIMYLDYDSNSSYWTGNDTSTNIISHNKSVNNEEFKINRLDIWADNLINYSDTGTFKIAENISRQSEVVQSYAFAQEFIAPESMIIDELMIYVNYNLSSLPLPIGFYFYFDIFMFDERFQEEIDWFYRYEDRVIVNEWLTFLPNSESYTAGEKYNIVLRIWTGQTQYNNTFNFWKAENYTIPSFNKGFTRRHNGNNWTRILQDDNRDMLCNFSYTRTLHPSDVDLKFIINNQIILPYYQESTRGAPGYEAYYSYTLDAPVNQNVNVTVVSNQTLSSLDVWIEMYYIHLRNASGTYTVDNNKIQWNMTYPYEDLTFGWPPPVFLFERDWIFVNFSDPDNVLLPDVYFGPIDVYNKPYYGIVMFFGPPLQKGNYTGIFNSPNYCNSIKTKVKTNDGFIDKSSLELGNTFKIEASIYNPLNEPISGGLGEIAFFSPTGNLIHNEIGLIAINGIMSSSEISLTSGLKEGTYQIKIFWTDGKEVAILTMNIEIGDPMKVVIFIGIGLAIAAAATPLALVTRRQLRQRNWEKSLKNLFVLTKEGLSLYEYSFGIEIQDPTLISAMIAALTNFVREATGSKKSLRTVDQEDKKVILYHGNYITTALLAEKDLPIIHKRISKFTEAFELEHSKNLKTWDGNTQAFKGTEIIVNKYFPLDVEDQVIRGVKQKLIEFREKLDYLVSPKEIISHMREITEFISRYRVIVNNYYLDYYNQIITIAEQKITNA
ncbi:MAG: hypothetical protein ACFE85_17465 [Candidatus Hodarchaeota archaeon]